MGHAPSLGYDLLDGGIGRLHTNFQVSAKTGPNKNCRPAFRADNICVRSPKINLTCINTSGRHKHFVLFLWIPYDLRICYLYIIFDSRTY